MHDSQEATRDIVMIEWLSRQILAKQMSQELAKIVDSLTPSYKNFLEEMGAKTRLVFVGLLEFGRPVTAKEVATSARFSVNEISAYLNRFVERGWVNKCTDQSPYLYESIDPFGYVICLRPGIEVYWRVRRFGKKAIEELSLITLQ